MTEERQLKAWRVRLPNGSWYSGVGRAGKPTNFPSQAQAQALARHVGGTAVLADLEEESLFRRPKGTDR